MDERKVSKARMSLVTSRCPRIRAPSSSMLHGKMALVLLCRTAHTRGLRAFRPREVDCTRPSGRWWVSAGFSQGPAYKSRPGLFTRPPSQSRSQTDTAVPYTAARSSRSRLLPNPQVQCPLPSESPLSFLLSARLEAHKQQQATRPALDSR